MEKRTVMTNERLREMRVRIHELATLQGELRRAVEHRRAEDQPEKSIGTIARAIGVSWNNMQGLLDRERVLCGDAATRKVATYARRPELAERICALAKEIPDRFLGVASATSEAIDCAFDLEETWVDHADALDQEAFARLFGQHSATVLGAIRHAHDALTNLETPAVCDAIRATIADASFGRCVASATETGARQLQEKSGRFAALVAALRVRYKLHRQVADALGVCRTTLTAALQGKSGEATVDDLITKATALLDVPPSAPSDAAAKVPAAASKETVQASAIARETLENLGGETSSLGVRFVLGSDSFREIDIEDVDAFIAFARRKLELARIVLNVSAQVKDDATRRRIREELGKEVEENELAIRIHTTRYPNRLTKLHQGEREAWAAVGGESKPQGKA